ncbi:MAG: isoprenylcysteine carboxylmethyltransferase family protein [Rhodospirillales bacterium]
MEDDDKSQDVPRGRLEKLVYAYYSIGEVSDERKAEMLAQDHAGVRFPPPLIYLLALVAGCAADSAWIYGSGTGPDQIIPGTLLLATGMALIVWGFLAQRAVGAEVEPWTATAAITEAPPYSLTRNPMYLGMTAAYIALAMIAGSKWSVATLFVCLVVVDRYVIDREEAYLEAKFGDAYLDYKARVRRWF